MGAGEIRIQEKTAAERIEAKITKALAPIQIAEAEAAADIGKKREGCCRDYQRNGEGTE